MISFKEYLQNMDNLYSIGEKIYLSIQEYLGEKSNTGVVVAAGHMGDTVWLCMYAEAFKKQHGYERVVYLFWENQVKLAELYPSIDEIMSIDQDEMNALQFYMCVNKFYGQNDIYYGYYHVENYIMCYPNLSQIIDRHFGVQLSTHTEKMIGLEENSYRNGLQIPFIPEFEEWKEMFKNSVMLLPAAISVVTVPIEFWVRLTECLQERGYSVYTNYNNLSCEFVVPGTDSIGMDLVELAALGQCFKGFVSLRSGACDLLAQADAPLFVLYKEESDKSLYDMKDHRKDSVRDYIWSDEQEEEIIKDILVNLETSID